MLRRLSERRGKCALRIDRRVKPGGDGAANSGSPRPFRSPLICIKGAEARACSLLFLRRTRRPISFSRSRGVSNGPSARATKIHDPRRRRHRRCLVCPRHSVRCDRGQGLHARIRVSRLSVRGRKRGGHFRDCEPLFRTLARTRAARHRRQAELQCGAGEVRHRGVGVLGHRRIYSRAVDRARARLSGAQSRPFLPVVRPAAAAAHLGGDFRLRRQRSHRHLHVCRAAHQSRAHGRRHRALVCRYRLQLLHRHRRHRLSARHNAGEGICRARMVCRPVAHHRVGGLSLGFSRHHHAAHRAAHLCRQLVLSRLHSDHRGPASRQ